MADTWYNSGGVSGSWEDKRPTPGIAPKGDISAIPTPTYQTRGAQPSGYVPGTVQQTGENRWYSRGAPSPGGFTNPVAGTMQQAIATYGSMGGPTTQDRSSVYAGGEVQERFKPTQSQITRPGDPRGQSRGGYAFGGGTEPAGGQPGMAPAMQRPMEQKVVKPLEAIQMPDTPEYKAEAYETPEEDPGVYKTARREAMGPGLRALREGTREAISSAQSLDNPNARGLFIKQALAGMGKGLENVAAGASREARGVAQAKRSEQLNQYQTKYNAKSQANLVNFNNKINTIAKNFAARQSAQIANYNAQFNTNPMLNTDPNAVAMGPDLSMAQRAIAQRMQTHGS